jgi:pectate lyase
MMRINRGLVFLLLLLLVLMTSGASAATNRPDGYKTICKIDEVCTVDDDTTVAFGASGKFVYKVLSGSFVCNADTFGEDPIPKKSVKECSISKTATSSTEDDDDDDEASQAVSVELTATGGDGEVELSWEVTGTITSVQVMRDTDANPVGRTRLTIQSGTLRSYTDESVVNGTSYWYWIKYTDADGTVGNSDAASATPSSGGDDSETSEETSGDNGDLLSCSEANTVQGFASIDGGTTGGAGGDSVTVTNGADLVAILKDKRDDTTPLIIYVDGTLTPDNSDGADQFDVKDTENLSIIGLGDDALLDGIGINIVRAYNIIVRNLTIRYNNIGQKDGISIQGDSHHVWIDHNEIYNSLDVDKDYYDELVSGKKGIDNITISYNYLHDSWKTSLWGSSDSDDSERRVTFLGNRWENVYSRLPLFRFGQGHVVNNYYKDILSTGINSRMGATIRIDGNYFEDCKNPIVSFYSDEVGYWDVEDNIFDNVTWEERSSSGIIAGPDVESTVSYQPSYSYSLVPAEDVREHVLNNAGVGKLEGCF